MERAARKLALERAIQEFLLTANASQHAFELPDDILAVMIELETLRDDSPDSDETTALVHSPLKPQPHLRPGVIVLPEPD